MRLLLERQYYYWIHRQNNQGLQSRGKQQKSTKKFIKQNERENRLVLRESVTTIAVHNNILYAAAGNSVYSWGLDRLSYNMTVSLKWRLY